jgi:hypothetical protein
MHLAAGAAPSCPQALWACRCPGLAPAPPRRCAARCASACRWAARRWRARRRTGCRPACCGASRSAASCRAGKTPRWRCRCTAWGPPAATTRPTSARRAAWEVYCLPRSSGPWSWPAARRWLATCSQRWLRRWVVWRTQATGPSASARMPVAAAAARRCPRLGARAAVPAAGRPVWALGCCSWPPPTRPPRRARRTRPRRRPARRRSRRWCGWCGPRTSAAW